MRSICVLFALLLTMSGGCAVRPAWPDPESAASAAAGIDGAIVLELRGEPTDVDPLADERLTMAIVVREALRHDAGVQAALARVRAAQADAHQARLLPNPVLSVVLRWPDGGGSPTIEAGIAADLLSLLRKPGEIDAADHRLRAASARSLIVVLDVLADAQRDYVEAQSLDALIPRLDERTALLDRLVALARSRLGAGEGTRLDLTTLEAQRVELDADIAEQRIERRQSRLALARLIGRPSSEADWPLDPWAPEAPVNEAIGDERAWVAAAMEHRPEVQARLWEIEAMGADVRLTRWALLDPVDAGIESERDDGNWSLGPAASVPLPLFDWGQAKREAAEAKLLESLHELTAVRRQVVQEVRQAHVAYAALGEVRRQTRERLIPLLEQRLADSEAALKAGVSDATPLILAAQDLQAGRARLIELDRRTAESLIDLYRAVGGPGRIPSDRVNDDNVPARTEVTP